MKLQKKISYVDTSTQCDISYKNTYYYPLILNQEPYLFTSSYYISTHKQKPINYSNFLNFSTNPQLCKKNNIFTIHDEKKENKLTENHINSLLYPSFTEKNLKNKFGFTYFGLREKLKTELFLKNNWKGKRKQMKHSKIRIENLFPKNYNLFQNRVLPDIKKNYINNNY